MGESTESPVASAELLETGLREVAASQSTGALDEVRVRYLGKKGLLTQQLKRRGALPA